MDGEADIDDPDDEITTQRRVYDYDHIGNREEATAGTGAGSTTYYCATNLNQYKYVGTTQPTCSTVTPNLEYDADGNLTGDAVYSYAWDAENRLVAVAPADAPASGDKMLAFKYDYMGRRVEKTYAVHNGSAWVTESVQRFVYDEWNIVLVLDDNNDTVRKYTWGLDLSRDRQGAEGIHGAGGIGGLLAVEETAEQGSPAYWFFYDANGNVGQAIKASDQSIAAKYEYDPYGNVVNQPSPYDYDNPIRFSTKWFDTELADTGQTGAVGETGLGYWGYRYYSPRLGRWVSRDPIGEAGGLDLYAFVSNRIPNEIDPLGLDGTATCETEGYDGAFLEECLKEAQATFDFCISVADTAFVLCARSAAWARAKAKEGCDKMFPPGLARLGCYRGADKAYSAMYEGCAITQVAAYAVCDGIWLALWSACQEEARKKCERSDEWDDCVLDPEDIYDGPCPGGTCI